MVEGGTISLTPRRHVIGARGQTRGLDGLFTAIKGSANVRSYEHEELEGTEVGTVFTNDTLDGELMATTRPIAGKLEGTYGVSGGSRRFDAIGEEALSPRVDQGTVSAFTYQEAVWPHVTLQFGGRVEHQSFSPGGGLRPRDFTNVSGSLGALFRPSDATTVAVSVARAVRNPALEELYFYGPHPGNFAFEVGNDDLGAERALGLDVAFRWRLPHLSGEVAYFHNAVGDFIFRQPTGETIEDFPVIAFTAADVLLQGVEAHGDVEIGSRVVLELGADYVRGELRATGEPLPRMPPFRAHGRRPLPRQRAAARCAGGGDGGSGPRLRHRDADGRRGRPEAVRRLLEADQGRPAHDHAAPRQRDQRDLPEPPVLHQGPGAGSRPQREAGLRRPVLTFTPAAVRS